MWTEVIKSFLKSVARVLSLIRLDWIEWLGARDCFVHGKCGCCVQVVRPDMLVLLMRKRFSSARSPTLTTNDN